MWTNRFLFAAVLTLAGLLTGASSAHAQGYGYVYGYYYPDSQEFVTFQERPHFQFGITPERMEAFTHLRFSSASTPMRSNSPPVAAQAARIEIMVPDAKARVWFDGAITNSTGVARHFQSPPLLSGPTYTYTYTLKASWMQDGKEVTRERTISVTPGQKTVVDFK